MPLSIHNLQTGHKYVIKNYGETIEFQVMDVQPSGDHKVKHLSTLEIFQLSELTRYGKGHDYELSELRK